MGQGSNYTIVATAGLGGSITPSGAMQVNGGASQTFTITPDEGYRVVDVSVDGSSVGGVTDYTFSGVAASHMINATFTTDDDIVLFDSGTSVKTVTRPLPVIFSIDVIPDSSWNGTPAEVFVWGEAFGQTAYFNGSSFELFQSFSEMTPVLPYIVVSPVYNFVWVAVPDSSIFPSGDYTLHVCFDRNINGVFDPSDSECGSVVVILQ